MSLLDDLLRLLGTNRTRLRWRLQQLRDKATRQQRSLANRSQSLTYEHQLCPSCGHPEAKGDKVCSRCGAKLHGVAVSRARRAAKSIMPEGVPVVTMVYIAACVALYYVTVKATQNYYQGDWEGGFRPDDLQLKRFGANYRELIQRGGEWWRLVTANFLHASISHIAMNAYGLWVAGSVIEERFGAARTAFVLLATGVAGAALSYKYGGGFSLGASTAGFGQMGFIVGHALRFRGRATADLRARFVPWLLYGIIFTFASNKIDVYGHLGGVGAGFVLGALLADKQHGRRAPRWLWDVVAVGCVGVVGWAFYEAAVWHMPEWFKMQIGA